MVHTDIMAYVSARLRFSQQCCIQVFWDVYAMPLGKQFSLKDCHAYIFMGNKSKKS